MKDQYFGDFGDYQKFSLLKTLRDVGGFRIIVHWMKTRNDSSPDGNRVSYLQNEKAWNQYDTGIFHFLKRNIDQNKRSLKLFESSKHGKDLTFLGDHIEEGATRQRLLEEACNNKVSDLVFFDPDNGIEVASTTQRSMHKYVRWNDIASVYSSGKNVLIYQHFSRKNREIFIREKAEEITSHISTSTVFVIRVKHSVYFFLLHRSDETRVKNALVAYVQIWKELAVIDSL